MDIVDKLIFLRYSAPCIDDFVMQGLMTRDYANEILEATKRCEVLPNSEIQFDLAYLMCERVAKKLGKEVIDTEVIRSYYLILHNKLLKIHKPIACSEEECRIEIANNISDLNTSFFEKMDKPLIVTHRNYVVDLLTKKELGEILSKSSYLETH